MDRTNYRNLIARLPDGMRIAEARRIAIGAVRSELRRLGHQPANCDAGKAYEALDHIWRQDPDTIAGLFYVHASDHQLDLFDRDWRQWRRQVKRRQTAGS